jgi:hypothetical protein
MGLEKRGDIWPWGCQRVCLLDRLLHPIQQGLNGLLIGALSEHRQGVTEGVDDCFKQVLGVVDAIQVSESVGVQLNLLGAIRHHGRGGEPPGLDGAGVENVEFIEELGRVLTQVGILGATAQLVNHLFDDFMCCPKAMCNVPLCLDRAQSA